MTLWKAWRAGPPHGEPIMGLIGRHGVTAVDPMNALIGMTMLFSAAFLVSGLTFFPDLSGWLRRQRDARWPPATLTACSLVAWMAVAVYSQPPLPCGSNVITAVKNHGAEAGSCGR